MTRFYHRRLAIALAGAAIVGAAGFAIAPTPAAAQFSNGYNFLKAVRDSDFSKAQDAVEQPGSTVINVRDRSSGEAALHIVTRRRDTQWMLFLLRNRANPDIRDNHGNTPLHIAAQIGYSEGVHWLTTVSADVNATNERGETPLIMAVQQHNADIVRQLVTAGADPDIADNVIGMSAHDYAVRDPRAHNLLEILDSAQPTRDTSRTIGPSLD